MKQSDLYICCGHGGNDSGAIGFGKTEKNMVRQVASEMKKLCPEINIMDTSIDHYTNKTFSKTNFPKNAVITELHMDGFTNPSAKGGHVIIYSGFDPDEYDKKLADHISSLRPGRASKIVKRNDLFNMRMCAERGFNYRLVELGFITNKDDNIFISNNMKKVATVILESFGLSITKEPVKNIETLKKEIQQILDKY